MVLTRSHVKEFTRRGSVKLVDNVQESKSSKILPFTETRLILAILGGLPCQLRSPYWPCLELFKSSFLYCVVLYTIASYNLAWTIGLKLKQFDDKNSENMRNLKLEQIINALLPHCIVLVLWKDTFAISEFMKYFIEIQSKFYAATGEELVNRRRALERFINAFVVFSPISFYIFSQTFIPIMFVDFTTGVSLIYSNIVMFLVSAYWIGVSIRLADAFEDAKNALERQFTHENVTPESLYKFRLLWLSMRSGMDSFGKLLTPAAFHSIVLFQTVVVVYVGASFLQVQELLAGTGHICAAAVYLGFFSLTCIASDRIQQKMKTCVGDLLPNIMISSYDIGTQREIVMLYLSENTRPAVMTVRGFQVVNKNLILSFISNVATYIIVLLQFLEKT